MAAHTIAGVYKIQHKKTYRTYIGQSIHVLERWNEHIYDAYIPEPKSAIGLAMKREGPEMFEFTILKRFDPDLSPQYLRGLLKSYEVEMVKLYNSHKNGYNRTPGGNLTGFVPQIKNRLF